MMIEVPNDFSRLHQYLIDNNYIKKPFWVASPDHISYFNKDGLINLCNYAGFSVVKILTDFPIDFNLLHEDTNYIIDRSKGKKVHQTRIEIENLLHDISIEDKNELYLLLAKIGFGRNIIGFFKNNNL